MTNCLHLPSTNFSSFFLLLHLFKIDWENRKIGSNGSRCLATIDGTDFKIYEPTPFDRKWYSHKTNGPGLRYEIGIGIQTGWIVWVNGPYPCGAWPDLRIARDGIIMEVEHGEMLLADGGYADGNNYFVTPTGHNNDQSRMMSIARARHETINCLFKQFGILKQTFRHRLDKHDNIFQAIANITQLGIELGETRVFEVSYNDQCTI